MFKNKTKSTDDFWREFEEKTGEKVLSRTLGKYISGWEEFEKTPQEALWGLLISTSNGFRFHHFPQNSWIDVFTKFAQREQPKEKTIFIPKEQIILTQQEKETKWWKKIFSTMSPQFIIHYNDENNEERKLIFEAEFNL